MIWAFVPGMVVAELEADRQLGSVPRRALFAVGVALIALSVIADLPSYLDLAAAVGAGLLIAGLVSEGAGPIRMGGLIAIAGAMSYSFYLWHEAIVDAIDRPTTWLGAGSALLVTMVVAAVVYAVLERPAIAVGRKLTTTIHSRRAGAAASLGRAVA
jgi:peptidoglycan/LPS O-acetylase OafA/YrhL